MDTTLNTHTDKPVYGVRPKAPGMYLGLFHGRERPEAVMHDWGFDGPVMGPLEFFHTTYANTIHLKFENVDDAELITGKSEAYLELELMDDLLCFDGKFYGDWTVYMVEADECFRPNDTFRKANRCNVLRKQSKPRPWDNGK